MTDSSQFRPDAIYVERQTRRAFYYVPREEGQTVDSIINQVLADWIKTNHPVIVEHLKAQHDADEKFKDEYGKVSNDT